MPKTKHASYRYRLIDSCLRRKHKRWQTEELLEHLSQKLYEEFDHEGGVSLRTLEGDIAVMRKPPPQGFDAPIVRKEGYIFYSDPEFSINENPLNEDDLEDLEEVMRLLKSFESLPQYDYIRSILGKIRGDIVGSKQEKSIIQLEHNVLVKGLEYVEPLYQAIKAKKVLEISYQPFSRVEPIQMIIHPYIIKEYNNRWYLIGWNEHEQKISNIALDRVMDLSITSFDFNQDYKAAYLNKLEQIVGVTVMEGDAVDVTFKVSKAIASYFATKPLHISQKVLKEEEDCTTFCITVIPNIEMEAELLRFGEAVEVTQPVWLREQFKKRIIGLVALYE